MTSSRRQILVASAADVAGLRLGRPVPVTASSPILGGGKAKSVILFFLCGASHVDTWDMKPDAPADVTKTVYYVAGIDNFEARDAQGRPYHLLDAGQPITAIF